MIQFCRGIRTLPSRCIAARWSNQLKKGKRLLLDSRVVDVPMASNPIVVTLSSLKPFFFNGLQSGGALLGPWWSIRPRNPIRAWGQYGDLVLINEKLDSELPTRHLGKAGLHKHAGNGKTK